MKVSFNRLAEAELIAAARYLEAKGKFGAAFLEEFAAWESLAKQFPESCPEIAPGIRRGYLSRFKYHVTYTVRGQSLRVLYVRSSRREPLSRWPRG
jgi:plasmid stabilization system protein ParE